MIELTPLARPYAKALFASALESKNIDEMASELKTMALASKTDGVINTIESEKCMFVIRINLNYWTMEK